APRARPARPKPKREDRIPRELLGLLTMQFQDEAREERYHKRQAARKANPWIDSPDSSDAEPTPEAGPAAEAAPAAPATEAPTAPQKRKTRFQPAQLAPAACETGGAAPATPGPSAQRLDSALAPGRAQRELARELEELHVSNANARDDERYRRRQKERKEQPWRVVEVTVREATPPPAPEFPAVTHWNRFLTEPWVERWTHAHTSFYEYRGLYLQMLPQLVGYAEQHGRMDEVRAFMADHPALTARGQGVAAQSVECTVWATPWKHFIDRTGSDPLQAGLQALAALSSDIRGKHAIFLDAVDDLQDPDTAALLRQSVTFTLQDGGDELRSLELR
ncbi:MAG TPA: hypothetical protein VFH51_13245, partial [Myxococcota bacterium]|nr:hypothetical protein [Myxococcota bacterium]